MRRIITIPHPTLRKVAEPIVAVDKRLLQLTKALTDALVAKKNPRGVGLAAPQVDLLLRMFCTMLNPKNKPMVYLNPVITAHSTALTLGKDPKEPIFEGCLSMPGLYGPVPRFEWIEIGYDAIVNDEELVRGQARLVDYEARVFQHELDHLDGVLFTDHSLKYDLPVYTEQGDDFIEVDKQLFSF